jgi:thioredoxin 1
MDILTRFGLAVLIVSIGLALYWTWTRLQLWKLRRAAQDPAYAGLETFQPGTPALLYFMSPTCAPCHTIQSPAVDSLIADYGEQLQVIKIDASERTDLADYWGVLSVPTTFIIDRQGRPRRVNQGVTSAAKLRQQLIEFGGLDNTPAPSAQTSRTTIGRELVEE